LTFAVNYFGGSARCRAGAGGPARALAPSGRSTPPVVFPDRGGSPPSPLRPSAPVSRGIRLPTVPPEHRRFGVAAPGRLTRPVLFAEHGPGWTSACARPRRVS